MHGAVARDDAGVVIEARVDARVLVQREHDRACQQRQQRQAAARLAMELVQLGAQGLELGDVDLLDIGEVRNAAFRLLHLLRNLAAQSDHLHLLLVVAFDIARAAAATGAPRRSR